MPNNNESGEPGQRFKFKFKFRFKSTLSRGGLLRLRNTSARS